MEILFSSRKRQPPFQISLSVLLLIMVFLLHSCDGGNEHTDELVIAGIDSPDEGLKRFFDEMIQSTRAMPNSGLMRGRLAMAYEANGFQDEAMITYEQAAALDQTDFRWPYLAAHLKARHERHQAALNDL